MPSERKEENAYRFFKGKNEPDMMPQKFMSPGQLKQINTKGRKKYLKQSQYFGFDLLHYLMQNDQKGEAGKKPKKLSKSNSLENDDDQPDPNSKQEFVYNAQDGQVVAE